MMMTETEIRRSTAQDDTGVMKALWKEAFCDTDEVIEAFFDSLYQPGRAVLALEHDELLGCAYLLPGVTLISASGTQKAASYLYAVSVRKNRRGSGIGSALMAVCREFAAQEGKILCLMPGDDGLRRWYSERCGFFSFASAHIESVSACDAAGSICFRRLSDADYAAVREKLLAGVPHAALPTAFFRFQERLCSLSGGALLEISDTQGNAGIACAERGEDSVYAKELLFSGETASAAAELARYFGVSLCYVTQPGAGVQTVMASERREAENLWWGPVFD